VKAIVYTKYGPPGVLQFQEVEKPVPKDNEVLIRVHAASVNDWDWGLLRGRPFVNRLLFGLLKPKTKILGCDVAGQVEAVGKNVKHFQPGDVVFGDLSGSGFGGFAQYVCAREDVLALKHANLTFEEAAAIPQAGVLAVQGLYKGKIQKGKKVLINGAGGGVGTFAVQIAKSFGAEVTGVDSTRKLDMLLSMGADHVIDYTKEDFTKNGQVYDLILDLVVYRSMFDYKRALGPRGILVMIGGSIPRIFQIVLTAPLIIRSKKLVILAHKPNPEDLIFINDLFEAGKVKPVIDRCYPLREVPEALRYFGEGHHQGKIVITLEHNNKT
jgi:NADPH:quinone reductase-like Zn-dependent oxidoreductase